MAVRMFIISAVLDLDFSYLSVSRQQGLNFVLLTKMVEGPKGVVNDNNTSASIISYSFITFPSQMRPPIQYL